jgi:hypothetical protein
MRSHGQVPIRTRDSESPAHVFTSASSPWSSLRRSLTATSPAIDPQQSALLVMDYQPAVLGHLTEAEAFLTRLADAIAVVRQAGAHVAYVL